MRGLLILVAAVTLTAETAHDAEAKKKPQSAAQAKKKGDGKPPPPGDKRTNEGAQGRMNATEDAARGADSPQFDHRP
jgi:hypothetical protein